MYLNELHPILFLILTRINELKNPVSVAPPNINGLFIRGYHIKLRYVAAAHYSMYRVVKDQLSAFGGNC